MIPVGGLQSGEGSMSALAESWSYDFSANVRCSDGVCRFETGGGRGVAPNKQNAEVEARAKVQRELSGQGKTILSLDLSVRIHFQQMTGTRRESGETELLALAGAAQVRFPAHLVYQFEAYDHGRFVAKKPYETDAANQNQLTGLMANAQAGFAQELRNRGLRWDAIYPIPISSRPLR